MVDDSSRNYVYIDLRDIEVSTQARFFAGLFEVILSNIELPSITDLFGSVSEVNKQEFQIWLQNFLSQLEGDLVIVFDHLEAIPRDSLQTLLDALKVTHKRSDKGWLITVVCGALGLAEHIVGVNSPFRGISKPVFVGDITDEHGQALLDKQLAKEKIKVSQAGQA
ncbi:MAG: hypothetical protein KDI79_24395 [Anaerolineae bacterium]|nr:hypothetical protein [Anaerolineae bacterium]